jgi:hypothetical protein
MSFAAAMLFFDVLFSCSVSCSPLYITGPMDWKHQLESVQTANQISDILSWFPNVGIKCVFDCLNTLFHLYLSQYAALTVDLRSAGDRRKNLAPGYSATSWLSSMNSRADSFKCNCGYNIRRSNWCACMYIRSYQPANQTICASPWCCFAGIVSPRASSVTWLVCLPDRLYSSRYICACHAYLGKKIGWFIARINISFYLCISSGCQTIQSSDEQTETIDQESSIAWQITIWWSEFFHID